MSPTECVQLVAYLAARCPALQLDDATPDAWYDDLRDVRFDDARESIRRLTVVKPFVSLAEILADVRKLRADRLAMTPMPDPPVELADKPAEFIAWHRRQLRDIADGLVPAQPELASRPVGQLLAGAFTGTGDRCPHCGRPSPLDSTTNVCQCGRAWSRPDVREVSA